MVILDILGIKTFLKKIDDLLLNREDKVLREVVNSSDVDYIVKVLETLPRGRKKTFGMLKPDRAARVLTKLSPYLRQYVLREASLERVLKIINFLESDEIADLINLLPPKNKFDVIEQFKKHDPRQVLGLVNMRSDTAGGLMKTELVAGSSAMTVREFTESLRITFTGGIPRSANVYVVGAGGKFLGAFNFNKLYTSRPETLLQELMSKRHRPVRIDQDQEEVVRQFDAQDAVELAVVDRGGALVGRITADDIIDVMRTEFSEDIYRLAGVFGNERADDPYKLKVSRRLPWLYVNLLTAVLAAFVVSLFTNVIDRFVILAAYMPIIAGMGGNAATQTLGVTIRAIALDELTALNTWRVILKEVFAGILNGAATGLVTGFLAYLYSQNLTLSVVIFAAMTFNLFIAGLGGSVIPLVMKALKIDPALASTVFVTTLTDVFGFFSFLGLATILLH